MCHLLGEDGADEPLQRIGPVQLGAVLPGEGLAIIFQMILIPTKRAAVKNAFNPSIDRRRLLKTPFSPGNQKINLMPNSIFQSNGLSGPNPMPGRT